MSVAGRPFDANTFFGDKPTSFLSGKFKSRRVIPGPSAAREPGNPYPMLGGYGFRVRRFAAPRNDTVSTTRQRYKTTPRPGAGSPRPSRADRRPPPRPPASPT